MPLQLNDTHPTIAVPELMRILMDENKLGWTLSWSICTKVCRYRHQSQDACAERTRLAWLGYSWRHIAAGQQCMIWVDRYDIGDSCSRAMLLLDF